jgi:branched-chain amino acid transport system substrate-binding protein
VRRLLAMLCLVGLVAAACGGDGGQAEPEGGGEPQEQGPIVIGYVGDFSDVYSFYDLPVRDGAQFAVDEINADGGVLGRELELVARDGRNDQAETVQLIEEMLSEGVNYIIGTTGDPFVAEALVACGANVPISTGDGTAPTLVADAGECAYQLVMSDNVQGAVAAQYAYDQGYRNAFMLRSEEIPYTGNLPTYFAEAFENLGGSVMGEEQYRIDAGDYSAQVTAIANLSPQPDVIFTPMFIPDTPVFMRQLRAAGVDIPVISTDGNHDASLLDAGRAVQGMVFTTHALPQPDTELTDLFARYEEETGEAPSSVVVGIGYDEIHYLKQAVEDAESADPEALIESLGQVEGFQGVTGEITMDPETRRAEKPVTLVEVRGGELTFVDQFYPDFVPDP